MAQELNVSLGDKVYVGKLESIESELNFSGELRPVEDIDVQWRRWEAAVAAMQGLLTHKMTLDSWTAEGIANYSFRLADAMVKGFKERGECCK